MAQQPTNEKRLDLTNHYKEEFCMQVAKLNYSVNNIGLNDSFDRTSARDGIEQLRLAFELYIQALIKQQVQSAINDFSNQ